MKKEADQKHKPFLKESGDMVALYHIFTQWNQIRAEKYTVEEPTKNFDVKNPVLDEVSSRLVATLNESNLLLYTKTEIEDGQSELETDSNSMSDTSSIAEEEMETPDNMKSPPTEELIERKIKSEGAKKWCRNNCI